MVRLGVAGDAVEAVPLTGLPTALAKRGQYFERRTVEDVDLLVTAVGHEDVARDAQHDPAVAQQSLQQPAALPHCRPRRCHVPVSALAHLA